MASWARQRQQITEAADGGARARTGADGAVVLNLRRGPGADALLSRADGQLTRAGQHYYSHLGLRPPSKDFDYNQSLIREGPNDYILLRNGQKKLVRSLRAESTGQGLLPRKYYEYLVHVPVIIRGAVGGTGAGYERGLAAGERAGRRNEAPGAPHGGAGGAAGQATSGGLWTRAAPSCSSRTRPTSSTRGALGGQHRARATGTPGQRWRRSCASA